jgi:hypothetical protein
MQQLLDSGKWQQYTQVVDSKEAQTTNAWRRSAWGIPDTKVFPADEHSLGVGFWNDAMYIMHVLHHMLVLRAPAAARVALFAEMTLLWAQFLGGAYGMPNFMAMKSVMVSAALQWLLQHFVFLYHTCDFVICLGCLSTMHSLIILASGMHICCLGKFWLRRKLLCRGTQGFSRSCTEPSCVQCSAAGDDACAGTLARARITRV